MLIQSPTISIMSKAVIKASRSLLRDFGELEQLQVSLKSNNNFVTSADLNSNRIIKSVLSTAQPTYGIISEEDSNSDIFNTFEYKWVIDPLDGTLNYMHGLPLWAISISLFKGSEVIAAVTYLPVLNELFWAEKGSGFYSNDKRLYVSKRKTLSQALITCKDIYDEFILQKCQQLAGVRKTGSTTINFAYTAAGKYDAYICKQPLNIWDAGAGMLFVSEAGGCLIDQHGNFTKSHEKLFIATNIGLRTQLLQLTEHSKTLSTSARV